MTAEKQDRPVWKSEGYLDPEDVEFPPKKEVESGSVAVIECPQRIPCDPCSQNCPVGAIKMDDINGLPTIDYEKCTGCAICVEHCPGLAIFTIDCSPSGGCDITIPYEFELPEVGEAVVGLNRKGEEVTEAKVAGVKPRDKSVGDTSTVTVNLPEKYVNIVRNIRRES